jgi:hypothetical protein
MAAKLAFLSISQNRCKIMIRDYSGLLLSLLVEDAVKLID